MSDQADKKRRSNIVLALILALVAFGFFAAFILVNMPE